MKNKIIISLFISFISCSLMSAPPVDRAKVIKRQMELTRLIQPYVKDYKKTDVFAAVDNKTVTYKDIEFRFTNMLKNHINLYPETPVEEKIEQYLKQAIDHQIIKKVLEIEIEKQKLYPKQEAINKKIEELKKSFPNDAAFQNHLKFQRATEEDLFNQFKIQMGVGALLSNWDGEIIKPSKEEIKSYYDQNKKEFESEKRIRLSVIFIDHPDKDDKKAAEENIKLMKRIQTDILNNKKPFSFYAKNFSDHNESRKNGGDMGFMPVSKLQKDELLRNTLNLKKGELSPVYTYPKGCFLAQITDIIPESLTDFELVENNIKNKIHQTNIMKNRNQKILELKNKSKITFTKLVTKSK